MEKIPNKGLKLEDRYEIKNELGAGGMAVVYLAHDREVAVKVLRAELGAVPFPVNLSSVSADLTKASVRRVEYRADAWLSRVESR